MTNNFHHALSVLFVKLFLMDNIKMDKKLTKRFYIVFQVLKVLLLKICKMQLLDLLFGLFLWAFTSADIVFHKFSFNIIWKKCSRLKFSFVNRFTQAPTQLHPFNSQNLLSETKVFCECFSWFFKIIIL